MPSSAYSLSFDAGANAYADNATFPTTVVNYTVAFWFKKTGTGTKIWMGHTGGGGGWRVQSVGGHVGLTIENVNDYDLGVAYSGGGWYGCVIAVTGVTARLSLKPTGGSTTRQDTTVSVVVGLPSAFQLSSALFGGAFTFDGLLDRVVVDDKAWSDGEADSFLADGTVPTGCIGLWDAEEGTGTTTADAGSAGATLTLNSGISWSSDVPAELAGGSPPVTVNPNAVTAVDSAVSSSVAVTQPPVPVTCASSVVGPAVTLSQARTPVTAAGSVVAPATALGYAAGAVGTVVTVPAPNVSGSNVTESPDPVTTAAGVVAPGGTLGNAPAATGSAGSAVGPTVTLTVAGTAVTVVLTVPVVTVSQDTVVSPSPVTAVAAVPAHLTVLAHAAGVAGTVVTVPGVTAGAPAVGVGGWCVAGSVHCPSAAAGLVYGHGTAAGGVFAPGTVVGRIGG